MNPTEARLATLRAMADYYKPKTNVGGDDVRRVILAEIAAVEAEAKGAEPVATTGTKFGGPSVSVVAEHAKPKFNDAGMSSNTPTPYVIEPAPPPARPKRVKVTVAESIYFKAGKLYDVIRWGGWNGEYPVVICEDGTDCEIGPSKWVPADETEGDETRYAEVILIAQKLVDSYAKLRSWDETTCADVNELRKALARAKVKS